DDSLFQMRVLTVVLIAIVGATAAKLPHKPDDSVIAAAQAFIFNQTGNAVIGGTKANTGQFPFTVAICKFGSSKCEFKAAGSLISDSYVLTTSTGLHYDNDSSKFRVDAGSNYCGGAVSRFVKQIIVHPDVNSNKNSHLNDIVLIQLDSPFTLNDNVKPIALPKSDSDFNKVQNYATFTGWGHSSNSWFASMEDYLRSSSFYIADQSTCLSRYSHFDKDASVCAGGPPGPGTTCNYDNGGPLFDTRNGNYYLFGLSAMNGDDYANSGCKYATIFTRVSYYCSWIEKNSGVKCV
ncbi:hypothetical protein PENTCL1PPCAC_12839, partial [Pristionchus entomophagus]